MFEELLSWLPPGQRELFAKVFTDLVARVEALEAKASPTADTPAAPTNTPSK